MDSLQFYYRLEDRKPIFTTSSDSHSTTTTESLTTAANRDGSTSIAQDTTFSPFAEPFHIRVGNEHLNMMQESRVDDTELSTVELEDAMMNLRIKDNESVFEEMEINPQTYYNMDFLKQFGLSLSRPNIWADGNPANGPSNGEMIDIFHFLIKTNNYVAKLTRDLLSFPRCIRPSLLYEMLQEVAKVRNYKRMRRANPNSRKQLSALWSHRRLGTHLEHRRETRK